MFVRKALIQFLDRPSFRWILSAIGTIDARRKGVERIWWDRFWFVKDDRGVMVSPEFSNRSLSYYKPIVLETILWRQQLGAGDVVVDVGAGVGTEMAVLAPLIQNGKIISIEAHPEVFEYLKLCKELNGVDNAIIRNVAVGNQNGTVTITDTESHLSNHIGFENSRSSNGVVVEMRKLAEILEEVDISNIDFLKMNIEGAEVDALLGMGEFLNRTSNACICCHDFKFEESGNSFFRTKDEVARILRSAGFRLAIRSSDSRRYVRDTIYATK